MNRNQILLAALLTAALKNQNIENIDLSDVDWTEIYDEAVAHEVHTIIYPLIKSLNLNDSYNKALISKWQKEVLLSGITQIQHTEQISKVFDEFNLAGIPFIALKGLTLRELYPIPEMRTMGDADILVKQKDIKTTCIILSKMGYKKQSIDSKHIHFIHNTHLSIEIHFSLISKGLLNKSLNEFETRVWENAKMSQICNVPGHILSHEDQLLHLILHMAVHLSSSGFGLRQLSDFSLMVEAKGNETNWNEVSKKIDEYGITRFAAALFIICRKLFNTQIPVVFKDNCLNEKIIENLIEDTFTGGIFGQRTLARILGGIQLHYINHTGQDETAKQWRDLISIIFPSIQRLGTQYSYAKNYPILTPIAWIHRIFYSFFRRDFTLSEKKFLIIPDKSIASDIKNHAKLLHSLDLK